MKEGSRGTRSSGDQDTCPDYPDAWRIAHIRRTRNRPPAWGSFRNHCTARTCTALPGASGAEHTGHHDVALRIRPQQKRMRSHLSETALPVAGDGARIPFPDTQPHLVGATGLCEPDRRGHERLRHPASMPLPGNIATLELDRTGTELEGSRDEESMHRHWRWPPWPVGSQRWSLVDRIQHHAPGQARRAETWHSPVPPTVLPMLPDKPVTCQPGCSSLRVAQARLSETPRPIRPTAWRRPHSNQKPARYPGRTADWVSSDQ